MHEFLTNEEEIRAWLDKYRAIGKNGVVSVDDAGFISVKGDMFIDSYNLEALPVKFKKITGNFSLKPCPIDGKLKRSLLNTLAGCPTNVQGSFDCSYNRLTSLVGGPKTVGMNYFCNYNKLTTLQGVPKKLRGLMVAGNSLVDLKYCPIEMRTNANFSKNKLLHLDDLLGTRIGGELLLSDNPSLGEGKDFSIDGDEVQAYVRAHIEKKKISLKLNGISESVSNSAGDRQKFKI